MGVFVDEDAFADYVVEANENDVLVVDDVTLGYDIVVDIEDVGIEPVVMRSFEAIDAFVVASCDIVVDYSCLVNFGD